MADILNKWHGLRSKYLHKTILQKDGRHMILKVTYLAHSGFLVEWDNCYWLFDNYKGKLDNIDKDKKLIVFVSHSHYDHFNKDIFYLENEHPDIQYYISSDIKLSEKEVNAYGITGELSKKIQIVKPSQEYSTKDNEGNEIIITTLKSTDKGVAYFLNYLGKTVYHAGDLHLWVWNEEDKPEYIQRYKEHRKEQSEAKTDDTNVVDIERNGQTWTIDI